MAYESCHMRKRGNDDGVACTEYPTTTATVHIQLEKECVKLRRKIVSCSNMIMCRLCLGPADRVSWFIKSVLLALDGWNFEVLLQWWTISDGTISSGGYDTSIFVLQKVLSEEIHSVHQKCLGPSGVSWSITSDCLVFGNPSTLRHQQPLSWSTMMVQQKSLSLSNLCHITHSGLVSPLHGL